MIRANSYDDGFPEKRCKKGLRNPSSLLEAQLMPQSYYAPAGKVVPLGRGEGRGKGRANFLRRTMCPIGSTTELGPAKRPDILHHLWQKGGQGLSALPGAEPAEGESSRPPDEIIGQPKCAKNLAGLCRLRTAGCPA